MANFIKNGTTHQAPVNMDLCTTFICGRLESGPKTFYTIQFSMLNNRNLEWWFDDVDDRDYAYDLLLEMYK